MEVQEEQKVEVVQDVVKDEESVKSDSKSNPDKNTSNELQEQTLNVP